MSPPRSSLRSRLTERLLAPRPAARTRLGRAPLTLYYQAGDPYSHLCAQLLRRLPPSQAATVAICVVPPPAAEHYPEAEAQRRYALRDAACIAPAYGLQFAIDSADAIEPASERCLAVSRQLLAAGSVAALLAAEAELAPALFSGAELPHCVAPLAAAQARRQLADNARRRQRQGHYLSGMWQFGGEWFWGLDRLDLLAQRLRAAGQPLAELMPSLQPERALLPAVAADALQCFYSFRSPYSYLVLAELERLHARGVALQLRPVLPMVTRGLPVPRAKRLYIARDVARLAAARGVPFGRIHDPLGAGVENCLKVFALCDDAAGQLRFCLSVGRAAWAEGLDLARPRHFRFAVERAGIDWDVASALCQAPRVPAYAEANRAELTRLGLWGVPSFQLGEFACWGQDRLWLAEELLRRQRLR